MNFVNLNVNCHVAKPVHTAPGLSQKKEISPGLADCYLKEHKLKYVKSASCVTQLSCVKPVTNVKNVASNLPVGARLQNFWHMWLDLGASPKAVQMMKEGYTLPLSDPDKSDKISNRHKLLCKFPQEPLLVRGIASAYRQKRSKTGTKSKVSGVFQPNILVPKPNKWRPILDLSKLNLFLKAEKI